MALSPYTFEIDGRLRLVVQLDHEDQAQKDVLAHFSKGQLYEHETSLLFVKALRAGDAVIDVGGNAGYFSMLSAAAVGPRGRVVTAEANPGLAALIRRTAGLNAERNHGHGAVQVEEIAVSERNGEIVFGSNGARDSNGGIVANGNTGDVPASDDRTTYFVARAETLDSLAARTGLGHVRLLKIDTEGHETQVLRGAQGLLQARRIDFIACELNLPGLAHHGSDQHTLRAVALGHGYHTFLFDHDGGLPHLVPPGTSIEQVYTCNILFAPLDRVAELWPTVTNNPAAIRVFGRR